MSSRNVSELRKSSAQIANADQYITGSRPQTCLSSAQRSVQEVDGTMRCSGHVKKVPSQTAIAILPPLNKPLQGMGMNITTRARPPPLLVRTRPLDCLFCARQLYLAYFQTCRKPRSRRNWQRHSGLGQRGKFPPSTTCASCPVRKLGEYSVIPALSGRAS